MRRRGINRAGLAALLPIIDGRELEVGAAVEAMPTGQRSPFARIGSTHFARLVLLRAFPGRYGDDLGEPPACVFFAAEFDIPVAGYLEALSTLMPDEADAVFGGCVAYPGAAAPSLFATWMKRHRVRAGFSLHGNPEARAAEVVDALRLRERVIQFALQKRALDNAALKDAWDRENWGRPP